MPIPVSKLSDHPVAEAALLDLCRPFVQRDFVPECTIVQPDQIPFPEDQLLVHHGHMTEVLEKFHGGGGRGSDGRVCRGGRLHSENQADPHGQPGKVVELGIARLDLRLSFTRRESRDPG